MRAGRRWCGHAPSVAVSTDWMVNTRATQRAIRSQTRLSSSRSTSRISSNDTLYSLVAGATTRREGSTRSLRQPNVARLWVAHAAPIPAMGPGSSRAIDRSTIRGMTLPMNEMFYTDPEHEPFLFEAGSSRALLIHGFLGSPRELRPLARELADAGVTARGVLLPGFGAEIARLKKVRAEEWLAAARAAWNETREGASRTTLIGFSMGRRGRAAARRGGRPGAGPAHPVGAALEIRRPARGGPASSQVHDPRVQTVRPGRFRQPRHAAHAGGASPGRGPRRSRGAARASQFSHHPYERPRRAAPGRRQRGHQRIASFGSSDHRARLAGHDDAARVFA